MNPQSETLGSTEGVGCVSFKSRWMDLSVGNSSEPCSGASSVSRKGLSIARFFDFLSFLTFLVDVSPKSGMLGSTEGVGCATFKSRCVVSSIGKSAEACPRASSVPR